MSCFIIHFNDFISTNGKLIEITSTNGKLIEITSTNGKLTEITSTNGKLIANCIECNNAACAFTKKMTPTKIKPQKSMPFLNGCTPVHVVSGSPRCINPRLT